MSFDPGQLLRKSTSRAKSDVANKLVSMLLHDLSRSVTQQTGLSVNSLAYSTLATDFFSHHCPYCARVLVPKHVAVEHLDGMNRFRAGLHVPGNVVISCSDCNREKRRDDQAPTLRLAPTGWESFLAHDSSRCPPTCKSCHYWQSLFPLQNQRSAHLSHARDRIHQFRAIPAIAASLAISRQVQASATDALQAFYRNGQLFATNSIAEMSVAIAKAVADLQNNPVKLPISSTQQSSITMSCHGL
jgi:hypothetical protein